jgi:hypothetical protein
MMTGTDLVKRKQLRGDIVTILYKDFGRPPMPVKTLIFALLGENAAAETEVPAQLFYLADPGKGFVTISRKEGAEPELTPIRSAFVQLTAVGCNLAEGDVDDPGVLFGDGRRA